MKKNLLFAILCVLGLFGTLNAQVVTIDGTVGEYKDATTDPTCNQVPVYDKYKYAITQQYYSAQEINKSAGTIESIAFKTAYKEVAGNPVGSYPVTRKLVIYMVNTEEYSFGIGGRTMKAMSENDLVFAGEVTFEAAETWTTIDIEDFEYTGGSLLVCVNDTTGKSSTQPDFTYFSTFDCVYKLPIDGNPNDLGNANRVLYKTNSTTPFDATVATAASTGIKQIPYIQIKFKEGTTEEYVDPSDPTNFVATALNESKIKLTWEAAAETESYNIYEGTFLVANVEGTEYTIKNLSLGEHCYTIKGVNGPKESTGVEACVTLAAKTVAYVTVGKTGDGDSFTAPMSLLNPGEPAKLDSWVEQIYTAEELGKARTIERLSFPIKSTTSGATPIKTKEIKIYLAETTKADCSDLAWTAEKDLKLVYSDTDIIIGDQEWETFEFDTPFEYSGKKNLAVVVAKSAEEATAMYLWHTNSVSNSVLYSNETSAYPTANGNLTVTRPVARFAWESEVGGEEGGNNEGDGNEGNEGNESESLGEDPCPTNFFFDFEKGNLNGLNVIDANEDKVTWQYKDGYDGGYGDGKGLYAGMPGGKNADDYIVTASKYTMTETSEFSFVYVALDYTFFQEKIALVVSEDGETFETVWSHEFDTTNYIHKWNDTTISLKSYVGKDLYVGLHHYGTEDGIRVDNLRLYSQEPSAPTNLKATSTETSITLTWDAVEGAVSYNVYSIEGKGYTLIDNVKETKYVAENLEFETQYSFAVTAVNEFKESKYSKGIRTTTALPEGVELLLKETFESYEAGQYIAKDGASYWTTWSGKKGEKEDGKIGELDGNKFGHFTFGNDQVLNLGGYQAGEFVLEFDIYVPEGKGGYYNILHQFEGNTSWALQAYFQMKDNGEATPVISKGHGSVHAGKANVADIPCVYNEWMHFRVTINANIDKAEYYYTMPNGNEVKAFEWQWSKDSFGESVVGRKLDAMNFFPPTAGTEYYIDNLTLKRIGGESAAIIEFNKQTVEGSMAADDLSSVEFEIENVGTSIAEYVAWVDYGEGAISDRNEVVSYSLEDLSTTTTIGWTIEEAITFEIAALYPSSAYAGSVMGTYITAASYFLGEFKTEDGSTVPMLEQGTDMIFRIYAQGINGKPGEVLAEKVLPAESIILDWNIVEFDEPVLLTGYDFYLAVEMTQCKGGSSMVLDGNVDGGYEGYGDLCRQTKGSAFKSLTEYTQGEKFGNFHLMVLCVGDPVLGGWAELVKKDGVLEIGAKETIKVEFSSFGLEDGKKYDAKIVFQTNTELGVIELPLSLYVWGENVEEILSNTYSIYPNPTSAQVTVEGENINYIAIYNSVGQLVKVVKTQNNVVDMSANDNGVYFFNIVDNAGHSSVQRVVVAK